MIRVLENKDGVIRFWCSKALNFFTNPGPIGKLLQCGNEWHLVVGARAERAACGWTGYFVLSPPWKAPKYYVPPHSEIVETDNMYDRIRIQGSRIRTVNK